MKKLLIALTAIALLLAAIRWLAPDWLARATLGAGRLAAGMSVRFAEAEGLNLRYLEGGSGATVVLVHGFGGDAENWLLLAPLLKKDFRVLVPDLPGFGGSEAPADDSYEVDRQADRLASLLRQLAPGEAVHVAGNSMGGQIAAVLAARHPEQVASLALLDPLGVENEPGVYPSPVMRAFADGRNLLLPEDRRGFEAFLEVLFYRQPPAPGYLNDYYARRWVEQRPRLVSVFEDISERYVPLTSLLGDIKVPTLILWGAEDQVLPAAGARVLAAGLRQSETVLLPACGHLPMVEKPRETAAAYRSFLQRVSPP